MDNRDFTDADKARFFKPTIHNHKRRAYFHDYTTASLYMVTVNKAPNIPTLSYLNGDPKDRKNPPEAVPTETGLHILNAINITQKKYPMFVVRRHVIMPDHVHLAVHITKDNSPHLGTIIGFFMSECTRQYNRLDTNGKKISFFERGFNDRIVYKKGQYKRFLHYIDDNPRRALIKRGRPDLFTANHILTVNGVKMDMKGNAFLLRHPLRVQVRFSSKLTEAEWEARCEEYKRVIDRGGVLVSPFIHPKEREWKQRALAEGASVVILVNNGFRERSAPGGELFDHCAAGRALIIAPAEYDPEIKGVKRTECMEMNSWARLFSEQDPEYYLRTGTVGFF